MRYLKVTVVLALVVAFMATSAFAGPSCSSSKQVKSVSASSENACLKTVFAGASNSCSSSKAKLAQMVEIESTRLPSGALVVMYNGKTEDAIAYLQASSAGSVENFCCPLTRSMASNEECTVEFAKTSNGVVIVVSSEKTELVDEFEQSFMQLASAK